jgi:hypothetical protein
MKTNTSKLPPQRVKMKKQMKKTVGFNDGDDDDDDDEIDPASLTFSQTILSVIPYTKEYKIAQAAFEMLDNLKRIKTEKSDANAFMVRAKIGQHEEAMAEMLAETTENLDYFIDLRRKMKGKGQNIRTEIRVDLFEELARGKGKNRLKKSTDGERDQVTSLYIHTYIHSYIHTFIHSYIHSYIHT